MKIIQAGYKIVTPNTEAANWKEDIYVPIETAGRICYQSVPQGKYSAGEFIRKLIARGHESVLEHSKMSVIFTVDRGVSHELVRHRLASYSQESTRYCNYSKDKFGNEITVVEPCFFNDISPSAKNLLQQYFLPYDTGEEKREITNHLMQYAKWCTGCLEAERAYFDMLKAGAKPEEARDILPTSLKTTVFMTANMREWRTIFRLRAAGEHGTPHPQMREVMVPLLKEVQTLMPELFDDIHLPREEDPDAEQERNGAGADVAPQ